MYPKLNDKIIGQGYPIVILHGLFGMLDNWQLMAKKLESAGFMSILIDQRDHGRSDHSDEINYQVMADDLLHYLDENWIHQCILMGHSMGGKTGLKFMSEHEDHVSKFIVVDIGIKKYQPGHQEVFEALFAVDLTITNDRSDVESILMAHLHDIGTVSFLMKNLTRKKTGGFEWKCNLPLLYREYDHILEEIKFAHPCQTPTLFIRGKDSNYILDEDIPILLNTFPQGKVITIDGAGHWVHADRPNELFEQIITFINE